MRFKVGDKVVYPSQGVSTVESISNEVLAGTDMKCYHLRLIGSESKVMVPVNNSERVGLRPLAEKKLVRQALKRLKSSGQSMASPVKLHWWAMLFIFSSESLGSMPTTTPRAASTPYCRRSHCAEQGARMPTRWPAASPSRASPAWIRCTRWPSP